VEEQKISQQMAKGIRTRRFTWRFFVLASAAVVGLGGPTFWWLSAEAEGRAELQLVQDDYQATWCQTFGKSSFDIAVFDEWFSFLDRNREFLEARPGMMTTDGDTGEQQSVLEWHLDWAYDAFVTNGPIPNFEQQIWEVTNIFAVTEDLLAQGENEFGKAVPLPCQ
jgi:hypothetical protein